MSAEVNIIIPAASGDDDNVIREAVLEKSGVNPSSYRILKRSIDARQRTVKLNLTLQLFDSGEIVPDRFLPRNYPEVKNGKRVGIIGAGPAGLFAALQLIELGLRPVIIERGKDVQARRRDLAAIHKEHIVNPDSNYCFGEGGAGTYSDGKLYTRSTKRGDVNRILEALVQFGASENILIEAHPHIGTNKLPGIIAAIRKQILDSGGEIHFNQRITDFILDNNSIRAVKTLTGETFEADSFILATGHSARDIFELLQAKNIAIEFKPFALGVRAEHPQHVVDSTQYHCETRPEYLPPASYNLVTQSEDRGVYSFCMCPGGIIAPCATSQQEVVTNGWSPSKRNNPWANSGIVVPVELKDLKDFQQYGPLAGMYFQKDVEERCWVAGGSKQSAPAQRLVDFLKKIQSTTLPDCSYQPGLVSWDLNQLLPGFITRHLRAGFRDFGKKMPGYLHPDAVLVAPESRTSSPVRIPRDKEEMHHPQIKNLFPCGEGAGYAGGIVSAAIDGEKIARKIAEHKHSH
ncbi:MAG: NAD(P)/FAD-dependent oxidoreductase [Flavobacteriales bacterium]